MIRLLWETANCIVVFKPAGLATQAPAPHDSLEARLRAQLSKRDCGSRPRYIALPHRLDRAVSGVVLVALSKRAARLLSQQFETRKISKTYLAWVQGQLSVEQDQWIDRLRKLPDQPQTEVVSAAEPLPGEQPSDARPAGQEAITDMRLAERQPWGSLLELRPLTGRMHQLRIQCAQRGHPILGDVLYGSSETWTSDREAVSAETIALHAWKITFGDPRNGKAVTVEAPPCWCAERMPQQP